MITVHNGTATRATVRLTLRKNSQTLSENEIHLSPDERKSIDSDIQEEGQYEFTAKVIDEPEEVAQLEIEAYDLREGSNVIVAIEEDTIEFLQEE